MLSKTQMYQRVTNPCFPVPTYSNHQHPWTKEFEKMLGLDSFQIDMTAWQIHMGEGAGHQELS